MLVLILTIFICVVSFAGYHFNKQIKLIRQLQSENETLRAYRDSSADLIMGFDLDCNCIYVHKPFLNTSCLSSYKLLGRHISEFPEEINSAGSQEFESYLQQVLLTREPIIVKSYGHVIRGKVFHSFSRISPEFDRYGFMTSIIVVLSNVTELLETEYELIQRRQEFETIADGFPDTVTRFDRNCRRIYVNPATLQVTGQSLSELLNKTPTELPGGNDAAEYQKKIKLVFETSEPDSFELHWRAGDGKEICSHIRLIPEFDETGSIAYVKTIGRDITEIDIYRKQIHNLAFFDSLTNLPNRSLLLDRIGQAITEASRHNTRFGLMLLDLDRFKEINDTLGHGVGDLLIKQVGDLLLKHVRKSDTVARLGGDEFVILLPEIHNQANLVLIAKKILGAFQQPFNLAGKELFITTSIGIAQYPSDSTDIDELLKFADLAMYLAKKQSNNFQFYSEELTTRSTERMILETSLRKACENNELELYYQPQVSLESGQIVCAEALLRWNHSEFGQISPNRFISIAEETGLINGIGEWCLLTACRTVAVWNRDRGTPLRIAVNLSARQFLESDLLGSVRKILKDTGCKPEWLKLEITESLLLEDCQYVIDTLNALDNMGLVISIDDFGTGYSALGYLNRFPVSQIKIDRSFVHGVPDNHEQAELVKAMISIAQCLKLELVAEGVETLQQEQYLISQGCLIAQGYLYGRPMPQEEFERKLDLETEFQKLNITR